MINKYSVGVIASDFELGIDRIDVYLHGILSLMSDTTLSIPAPKIQARTRDILVEQRALEQGLHPLLARILAGRPLPKSLDEDITQIIAPRLAWLINPLRMCDMQRACERVADAVMRGEVIGLETDHDCDGQTSHAVLHYNLVQRFGHKPELVRSYIGHRLTEGYGLSAKVAERILQDNPRPTLVITADNGSTDEERIKLLLAEGIEVIVTDHHQLPLAGPPASAYACLNPTRSDCEYGDPYIAGCMVAWLLMSATRNELVQRGHLPASTPKLEDSLDYVAVGTVADCVSMARSCINRAIVAYGLKLINSSNKPCWQVIRGFVNGPLFAEDLGFKVGPLLNSDGRLASAFGSVSFLLAPNLSEAQQWLQHLQEQNTQRKALQNNITQLGMLEAVTQINVGKSGLCIYLPDGHSGVHGISASRIKDAFGRPAVFLAPKQNEEHLLTGSIRGIEGFHVAQALRNIMQLKPGLLLAGGGHAAAGGVTLRKEDYELFAQVFEEEARSQLGVRALGPVIFTDGELDIAWLDQNILQILRTLEPYGREFEAPIFEVKGVLTEFRVIGDGRHARVALQVKDKRLQGVWFNFRANEQEEFIWQSGLEVTCILSVRANNFGGVERCEIQVAWMETI